jgi:uncharacterized protein (TIGR02996 family)
VTDLEALYRAVLASPDEDTPRLAYADEVEERGDPERAELIRLACECAKYDPATNTGHITVPMAKRMLELHTANRERWEPVCVACGGSKKGNAEDFPAMGLVFENGEARIPCPACKGSGRQPCRWERGFPVVEVAEMRQAWQHISDYRTPPALSWEPTPWLLDAIRAHHIAGVAFTGPFLITSETVPWAVMKRLKGNTLGGESWVLVALEWADAREVVA